MKKLILVVVVALFTFSLNAQGEDNNDSKECNFYAGLNVGLPIGDAGDWYSFSASVDLSYLFDLSDDFKLGASTGYANWFGKEGGGDLQFVPVAGALEYDLSDDVSIGGDIGYAINVGIGGGGDLYYKPYVAYKVSNRIDITGSYANISGNNTTFSTIQVGGRISLGWRSVLK